MVAHVMARLPRLVMQALLAVVPTIAVAEELPDPTRPPVEFGVTYEAAAGEASAAAKRGLQSVIISPNRRAAIINGQTVELGGKYGEAELIEVSEDGIVLRSGRNRQKLLLMFPGVTVKKKVVLPAVPTGKVKAVPDEDQTMEKADKESVPQEEK